MYIILENDDALRLAAAVQQHMTKGRKPLGGVSCYYNPRSETVWYVQALVRESSGSV